MKKFYLGIDIGTDSVGMACTDENYKLLRAKGKDLWCVRLFDEANDAKTRRANRTARRRTARRAQRIDFLQGVFAPEMQDEMFFLRLNNSGFSAEDKDAKLSSKFSLFADADFTDKDFYAKYPTIFHLRSDLITSSEKRDLRLYYLAIHHIVKYRGHFLSEGSLSDVRNINNLFEKFNLISEQLYGDDAVTFDVSIAESFKTIALDGKKGLNDKKRECAILFGAETKQQKETVALMLGGSVKPKVVFDDEKYEEEKNISFKGMNDEEFDALGSVYGDDFDFLAALRDIYSFTVFEKVLGGESRISDAMVGIYEKHKKDLAILKRFVKNNMDKDAYFKIFKSTSKEDGANYAHYIGYSKPQKKKINCTKCNSYEDFIKFLKKMITSVTKELSGESLSDRDYILNELNEGAFLPKILNSDNGIFPHQINEAELNDIVKNLVRDYPQFGVKSGDGISPAEKISKIFGFRVPYYVGPLNTYHSGLGGNSWAVRKAEGKITPWNFDEKIDRAASNENFIRRMTNKCTYLYDMDVLPNSSIIYQKFDVLNQLNKLRFNGQLISVELKKKIYNEVFLTTPKVTDKRIKSYLVNSGVLTKAEADDLQISGKDGDKFSANMGSYITLKKILGDYIDDHLPVAEDIILWHTLNTDKNIVEELILKKYGGEPIIAEKIKQIKGLASFKDFGKLSKEFLCEIPGGINPETGEIYTILGELYETGQNLNEILNNEKYGFLKAINEKNGAVSPEIEYKDLEKLQLSPQTKRGVWQAIKMVDEYVSAVGRAPDKIFVEVTRKEEKEKKRTVSRKNQILDLYKNLKDVNHLIDELNDENMTDMRLRSERLYLYFMQLGRCAYSGQVISLEQLNTDIYDVDHIIPQSKVKDDSLNNKVLVLREKNREKADIYPLKEGFSDQKQFWKVLLDKNLMSKEKYDRLTRIAPLTDEDYGKFINRQLVVTSQSAKAVAELLKRKFAKTDCKIVYSKAQNVSDFKQKFDIVKCRETNDLHHARDAYLNIVVGNVYDSLFTANFRNGKYDGYKEYDLQKLFTRDRGEVWKVPTSIETVKNTLKKPSMAVTRYSVTNKGEFYNQTVYDKNDTGVCVPRKNFAPYNIKNEGGGYKYGGFKSLSTAYFSIVSSLDKKGNRIKTIEAVPVYYDYKINKDITKLKEYFETVAGLKGVDIIVPVLKIKSLLRVNGFPVRIAGTTGTQILLHNAVQWFTDSETDKYVNILLKLAEYKKDGRINEEECNNEEFIVNTNRFGKNETPVNRENNLMLYDTILAQLNRPVYSRLGAASTFCKNLNDGKEKFLKLSVLDQAAVLLQCIKFLKCNAETSDLKLIGGGAGCGKLLINKKITDVKVEIIDLSPCGLIERVRSV